MPKVNLTETQGSVIRELNRRGAATLATAFSRRWSRGKCYFANPAEAAVEGLADAIRQGNDDAMAVACSAGSAAKPRPARNSGERVAARLVRAEKAMRSWLADEGLLDELCAAESPEQLDAWADKLPAGAAATNLVCKMLYMRALVVNSCALDDDVTVVDVLLKAAEALDPLSAREDVADEWHAEFSALRDAVAAARRSLKSWERR